MARDTQPKYIEQDLLVDLQIAKGETTDFISTDDVDNNKKKTDPDTNYSNSHETKKVLMEYSVNTDRDVNYNTSHEIKKVLTNYSVIHIPGDGRCMFRSVVHGHVVRLLKCILDESAQKELADELRALVADEFVKRQKETEWFIPDDYDFDSYVARIREPHVWGGELELLMASHVLRAPITVYMNVGPSGGLISIAEYGHDKYGNFDPIKVLFHVCGHYDALHSTNVSILPMWNSAT